MTIEAVRGMRDVLPADYQPQSRIAARLDQTLAGYGYLPIDLPLLEQRDLYLRKLGEELVGKVYEFTFNGRDLALRPEWTASVLRAYVARMQDQPLPLRLRYTGPVFRNERPQRMTYRQFTQIGVELIGGSTPRADAECLALACEGLQAAGIESFRVRIGHIGLIRTLLAHLGLSERIQGVLAWSLERMRSEGPAAVRERLNVHDEALPFDPALLNDLADNEAEALLLHTMRAIGVNLRFGTRPPEEIVRRLVRKLRRDRQPQRLEQALALLHELCQIQGRPAETLPAVQQLLQRFDLPSGGMNDLQAILHLAAAHGIPEDRLTLDFGLGRGLHYYTGMIFEIYDDHDLQLCGGGRYDELVTALGGRQPTPAVGFAYGLERVTAAVGTMTAPAHNEVLVVALDDAAYPYAVQVAGVLRKRGYVTLLDVRGRSPTVNLRDAARRELRYVALVGAADQAAGMLTWRNPANREEQRLTIHEIPSYE